MYRGSPSSPLQALLKPSEDEAPFKRPLQAPFLEAPFSVEGFKRPSTFLKASSSPLQSPLKPPSSPLQAVSSEGEAPLKPSEGEAPFKPS